MTIYKYLKTYIYQIDYNTLLNAYYKGLITRRQLNKLSYLRTGIKSNYG
jgi:hypothetical protein